MQTVNSFASVSLRIAFLLFILLLPVHNTLGQEGTMDSTIHKKLQLYAAYGNFQLTEPLISEETIGQRFLQYGFHRERRAKIHVSEIEISLQLLDQFGQNVANKNMGVLDSYTSFYFPARGIPLVRDKLLAYVGPNMHLGYFFYTGWEEEEITDVGLFFSFAPGISFRIDYYLGSRIYLNALAYTGVYNLNYRSYLDNETEITSSGNYFFTQGMDAKLQANVYVHLLKFLDLTLGYRHQFMKHPNLDPALSYNTHLFSGGLTFRFNYKQRKR